MTAQDLLVTLDAEGPLPGWLRCPAHYDCLPAAIDPERFVDFAREHMQAPRYRRVILVGDGEALEQHGFEIAQVARAAGFAHVQLWTSARRLTEPRTIRAIVQAGVDEFALSLFADEAELHDQLCGRGEDFEAVTKALARLAKHEVQLDLHLLVTTANLERLPAMIERGRGPRTRCVTLSPHAPPIALLARDAGRVAAEAAKVPALDALLAALPGVRAACAAAELELRLRHIPLCVLGEHAELLDNSTPDAFDGVRPGRPLPEFNCMLEAKCEDAERCGGLAHAHVHAHGWELARLRPRPRVRPWRERDRSVERSTVSTTGPRGHGVWLALLGEHAAKVESVNLTRTEARYPMQLPDGTRIVFVITARDDGVRSFTQTRSFNLAYTDAEGPAAELDIANYLAPVLATVAQNDDGSLTLDAKAG